MNPDGCGPPLQAFFAITSRWGLSEQQQRQLLRDPPISTFSALKRDGDGALTRDQLERVSYVLGIYQALQVLFPDSSRADAWIKAPNAAPCLGGRSALDRMLSGNVSDLLLVRQYLDAQCVG